MICESLGYGVGGFTGSNRDILRLTLKLEPDVYLLVLNTIDILTLMNIDSIDKFE